MTTSVSVSWIFFSFLSPISNFFSLSRRGEEGSEEFIYSISIACWHKTQRALREKNLPEGDLNIKSFRSAVIVNTIRKENINFNISSQIFPVNLWFKKWSKKVKINVLKRLSHMRTRNLKSFAGEHSLCSLI